MQLKPLMTYHADLEPTQDLGLGPHGHRNIAEVTGGAFEGERLRGRILTPGGDWLMFDSSRVGRLDVRATFETDDGALIYVQYFGVLVMNETVQQALVRGEGTDYGDTHFMTQPRFETSHPDYLWLNTVVAVGEGRIVPGGVEYQVYECLS